MGPMASVDGCRKACPPSGFDPRTIQPVASRYTDVSYPSVCVCVCVLTKFFYKVLAVSLWQFVPYFQNMLLILMLSSRYTDDTSSY